MENAVAFSDNDADSDASVESILFHGAHMHGEPSRSDVTV